MEPKKTYLKLHLRIMHILLALIHGRPRLRARDLARGRRHAAADGAEPDVWKQRVSRLPAACLPLALHRDHLAASASGSPPRSHSWVDACRVAARPPCCFGSADHPQTPAKFEQNCRQQWLS